MRSSSLSSLRPSRTKSVKAVIGHLFPHLGVATDDVGQGGLVDLFLLIGQIRIVLIEKSVSVAQSSELVAQDLMRGWPHRGALHVVFGHHADPGIDLTDLLVGGSELIGLLRVAADLTEVGNLTQTDLFAQRGEVGQPVISSSLNIEGGEVEPTRSGAAATGEEVGA